MNTKGQKGRRMGAFRTLFPAEEERLVEVQSEAQKSFLLTSTIEENAST